MGLAITVKFSDEQFKLILAELRTLNKHIKEISMTHVELEKLLTDTNVVLEEIEGDIKALLQAVTDSGNVPEGVVTAANNLNSRLASIAALHQRQEPPPSPA